MHLARRPAHSGAAVPRSGLAYWVGDKLGVPGPVGWVAFAAYGAARRAERPGRAGATKPAQQAASKADQLLMAVMPLAIVAGPQPAPSLMSSWRRGGFGRACPPRCLPRGLAGGKSFGVPSRDRRVAGAWQAAVFRGPRA
jgi:hypothetical protein